MTNDYRIPFKAKYQPKRISEYPWIFSTQFYNWIKRILIYVFVLANKNEITQDLIREGPCSPSYQQVVTSNTS